MGEQGDADSGSREQLPLGGALGASGDKALDKCSYKKKSKKTELNGTCWEKEFLECSIRLLGHSFMLLFAFDGVRTVTLL